MEHQQDIIFLKQAIVLAKKGMDSNQGGPFGAIVVHNKRIIGEGWNKVTTNNDPTAHAEVVAIRQACQTANHFSLEGCTIYTSCEPCPMCLSAIYWARIEKIFFSNTRKEAQEIGFDDSFLYDEIPLKLEQRTIPISNIHLAEAKTLFQSWLDKTDKTAY